MLTDLQIFSDGVYPPSATSRTISFSISNYIAFGINLIHFFYEKKDGATGSSIVCLLLRSPVTPFDSANFRKNANCFEECEVFGNGMCELVLSAIQEGRK